MPRKRSSEPTAQGGRETALRLLSRREHAAAELKYKLVRRGHDESTAADIVGQLAGAGWQSDARYAGMLVRSRVEQGYGPLRIRAELEAARVPESEIRAALDAAEVDWAVRAASVHARKFRDAARTPAEWQKQYRHLAMRGFEATQIRAALKRSGARTPDDAD